MSSRRVSRSLRSSHRVDAERSASTLRFRGDARLVALAAAALGVLASCGDDSSGVSIDSGTVTRLDGELPDVPRPSLDALTGLETGAPDAASPPPGGDASSDAATDAAGSIDGGSPRADSGPVGDAGPTCAEIAAHYARDLAAAQTCTMDAECDTLVCDGPCCNCRVHVREDVSEALTDILRIFEAAGCLATLACPDFVCPEPTGVTCYRGACMTSRASARSD